MFDLPDLTNLTLRGLISLLVILAATDVAINSVLAIIRSTFSIAAGLDYLRTHVLLRVFPIAALALVGHGIAALDVPAILAASLAAQASLALYAIETLASLRDGFTGDSTAPTG